jgi:hypothetical protein
MLTFLLGTASDRKLRLFCVACCRRLWLLFRDDRSRRAIDIAERFADGVANIKSLRRAGRTADKVVEAELRIAAVHNDEHPSWIAYFMAQAAWMIADPFSAEDVVSSLTDAARLAKLQNDEPNAQVALLRNIFGNLFRLTVLEPSWLRWNDLTVPRIAEGIYEDRAFERLPILADALLDAGCDNDDIIQHCREPRPHVRGCWAVDRILGKA